MTAMPPALPALPRHLAVIMDGNGRWAQQRLRPRIIGHRAGARAVNVCIDFCLERGIRALTLFAFSSENWGRPQEEVGALMKLFMGALDREVEELHRRGVRVRFIGERERFSPVIRERMQAAEAQTGANTKLDLVIAASYGGRQDIAQAARTLATEVAAGYRGIPEPLPDLPQLDAAAVPVSIIHGWDDELIPAQAVTDWAHARRARLLLVDDGHRLSDHVVASAEAFGQLLAAL